MNAVRSECAAKCAVAAAFLAAWGATLRFAAPGVTAGDSGEFITAAATLSIPHAPGYPLFTLLGRAFLGLVPWGGVGLRMNFFSASLNALAVAFCYLAGRRLWGFSRSAACFAALALAFSPAFFHHGLVTEVFALNTAAALAVAAALAAASPSAWALGALLLGLGLGNHQTLVLLVPALAWLWIKRGPGTARARLLLFCAVVALLAFAVNVFLAARAGREPFLNWGHPDSLERLFRAVTRKDYGSFSLALGETPARTAANALRQAGRFFGAYADQFGGWWLVLVALGVAFGWRSARTPTVFALLAWFFTGPAFAWLGNLPFDAQSDGVLERFYILPVAAGVFFLGVVWERMNGAGKWFRAGLAALPVFLLFKSVESFPLRRDFLVEDYSRSIFRTLPFGSTLFMDGGDDTFYSTAYRAFVLRERPDVTLFDRGGLIFRSAYGAGFRSLPRDAKEARRQEVERARLSLGPVFYSTMNDRILRGVTLSQRGFLYRVVAAPPSDFWTFFAIRSLYPTASDDYRTNALAPYFPFQHGRDLFARGRRDEAARALRYAWVTGAAVPWVKGNLIGECLRFGFDRFQAGDWPLAERFYLLALAADPAQAEAMTDLGALAEKQGRLADAAGWYERALAVRPDDVQALYNLAVVHWRNQEWPRVVELLERVMRIDPAHPARKYLEAARARMGARS